MSLRVFFFVTSRTRTGCTDPYIRGGWRTLQVSSRFGSKLPHFLLTCANSDDASHSFRYNGKSAEDAELERDGSEEKPEYGRLHFVNSRTLMVRAGHPVLGGRSTTISDFPRSHSP